MGIHTREHARTTLQGCVSYKSPAGVCRIPSGPIFYGHTANGGKLGPIFISFYTPNQPIFPYDDEELL